MVVDIFSPTWNDFTDLVSSAKRNLLICSPYYSLDGLDRIVNHIAGKPALEIWTKLSPSDWCAGVSDPPELLALLLLLQECGHDVRLLISERLHAKVFSSDAELVLLGSANLSAGGFAGNVEIVARFRGIDASQALLRVEAACRPYLRLLSIEDFGTWIAKSTSSVEAARRETAKDSSESLSDIQRDLDELLGLGTQSKPSLEEPAHADLERYVEWLRENQHLAGAVVLLNRHENLKGDNLQGHFKQSFFAVFRFLTLHPDVCSVLSDALVGLSVDSSEKEKIFSFDDSATRSLWLQHVEDHAMDRTEHYSYSVLRGLLPPALGGTRSNGGGASSTAKRMLPLVARYILKP